MKTLILTIDDIRNTAYYTGLDNLMDEMIRRLEAGLMKYDNKTIAIPLAMEMFIECANDVGLGTKVYIESNSADPENPYEFLNLQSDKSIINNERHHLRQILKNYIMK